MLSGTADRRHYFPDARPGLRTGWNSIQPTMWCLDREAQISTIPTGHPRQKTVFILSLERQGIGRVVFIDHDCRARAVAVALNLEVTIVDAQHETLPS
jgi:hypothetical protein